MADFGEILRSIGEFGLFQKVTLFALSFPNILHTFVFASFVFIQSDLEKHCNTDWILRADPNLTTEEQLNLTLPWEEDGTVSGCRMFVPVDWDIGAIREFGLNETTTCQNGWVYNNMMYEATIVTDFDLVCNRARLVAVIQAMFIAGALIGTLIFGPFAELFGRKWAVQIPAVIMFIFTVTTGLCPNVYLYLASQFLMACGAGAYQVNSIILCTEWIGVSKRSWGSCVTQLFSAVGQCIAVGVIYAIRDWRLVQLITAAPLTAVVVYVWFIPESARWLLNRGRTEEAKELIIKVAAINKCTVPDDLLDKIAAKDVRKEGIKVIFKSSVLLKYFFIIVLGWFSVNLSNFSLFLNTENLGLDIFVTQLLYGATEIPAHLLCMWLLEVLGRKKLLVATLLTGGLSGILILAVPRGHDIPIMLLAVTMRFVLTAAGSTCTVLVQELFPTSVRQTATVLGTILGRTGTLLAPLLNMLAKYHWVIPITVFSSLTLVSGGLSVLLPETRRKDLPDTVVEAENDRNGTSTSRTSCPAPNATKL